MLRRRGQSEDDYERQELARLDGQREGDDEERERADLQLWTDRALQMEEAQEVEARRRALRARQRRQG